MNDPDPRDLKARRLLDAQRAKQSDADTQEEIDRIKWLMSGPRGRDIVWWLLEQGQVFSLTWDPHSGIAAFREGQRATANKVWLLVMEHTPEMFETMTREAKLKKDADRARNEATAS